METKKIYRLEYKGYGVYRCTFTNPILIEIRNRMADIHSNEHTHPNLFNDFDKNIIYDIYFANKNSFLYRFGCDSMEKLVKWFGSFFDELVNNGVRVKEYTILSSNIYESNSKKQVIFNIKGKVNLRTLRHKEIEKYLQKDLVV